MGIPCGINAIGTRKFEGLLNAWDIVLQLDDGVYMYNVDTPEQDDNTNVGRYQSGNIINGIYTRDPLYENDWNDSIDWTWLNNITNNAIGVYKFRTWGIAETELQFLTSLLWAKNVTLNTADTSMFKNASNLKSLVNSKIAMPNSICTNSLIYCDFLEDTIYNPYNLFTYTANKSISSKMSDSCMKYLFEHASKSFAGTIGNVSAELSILLNEYAENNGYSVRFSTALIS